MSWAQVECVKCGQPMGDHAGLFVGTEPWHTACHYNVLTARLAEAEARNKLLKQVDDDNTKGFIQEVCAHAETMKRLAEAERERDEYYRLWKEACRVKDVRHKAAKERRNSICLDCMCMRACLKVSDKWVCPECLTARLAAAEALWETAVQFEGPDLADHIAQLFYLWKELWK